MSGKKLYINDIYSINLVKDLLEVVKCSTENGM